MSNLISGKITYTTIVRLTADDINDILTTALEGGIGYWGVLDNSTTDWKETSKLLKDPTLSEVATTMLFKGKRIRFFDAEGEKELVDNDDPDCVWYLDLDGFTKGCSLYESHWGSICHKIRYGDFDAGDADAIIQYALFDDIIFG